MRWPDGPKAKPLATLVRRLETDGHATPDQFRAGFRANWTEAQLTANVLNHAADQGWLRQHQRNSINARGVHMTAIQGDRGWPDIVACRQGRLLIAELKTETGSLTPDERRWLDVLATVACAEVFVWRPRDWPEILEVLA